MSAISERMGELGAALLWLRNHYDAGDDDAATRAGVLKVVDSILNEPDSPNTWVTIRDLREFQIRHLRAVEVEVGQMHAEARNPNHSLNVPLAVRVPLKP